MSFITPTTALLLAAAYFLGSIPFGLILAKLFAGSDIRKSGSGNIGATNVARVAGPAAGILALALDVAKGAAAVWRHRAPESGFPRRDRRRARRWWRRYCRCPISGCHCQQTVLPESGQTESSRGNTQRPGEGQWSA